MKSFYLPFQYLMLVNSHYHLFLYNYFILKICIQNIYYIELLLHFDLKKTELMKQSPPYWLIINRYYISVKCVSLKQYLLQFFDFR